MLKKKIWANFQRIVEVFTKKIFNMLSYIWVWDPGSEIRKKPIPDPGVKKAPNPGSGSATLIFCWHLESHRRKEQDPELHPDLTVSQLYESADPDPYQNVTDLQHGRHFPLLPNFK
jgi:hypothetical protein